MTIFEYRQTLDLQKLVTTGTISINVHRNQELYMKYAAYKAAGLGTCKAIEALRSQKYFRKITTRTIYFIIKELETEV
jgi:hypothetical protein